jgi:hypothetical protein
MGKEKIDRTAQNRYAADGAILFRNVAAARPCSPAGSNDQGGVGLGEASCHQNGRLAGITPFSSMPGTLRTGLHHLLDNVLYCTAN